MGQKERRLLIVGRSSITCTVSCEGKCAEKDGSRIVCALLGQPVIGARRAGVTVGRGTPVSEMRTCRRLTDDTETQG